MRRECSTSARPNETEPFSPHNAGFAPFTTASEPPGDRHRLPQTAARALLPTLTPLDERVRVELRAGSGRRARAITRALTPRQEWRRREGPSHQDVLLILRGFEHLGLAECRNGWWRAREPDPRGGS